MCQAAKYKDKFVLKRVNKGCRIFSFAFYSCARVTDAELLVISVRFEGLTSRQQRSTRDNFIAQQLKKLYEFSLVEVSNFKCFSLHSRSVSWETRSSLKIANTNVAQLQQINYQMIRSHFPPFLSLLQSVSYSHVWYTRVCWNLMFVWKKKNYSASFTAIFTSERIQFHRLKRSNCS